MAETTPAPNQMTKRIEEILNTAEDNLKKISTVMAQFNESLSKAKDSQARADNEALRASQAKSMVEEHSTAVAKLKGTIEADAAAIAAKKNDLDVLIQNISNLKKTSESDTTSISNTRKTAEESGNAIKETSGKIAAIQGSIDTIKKNVDATTQTINQNAQKATTDSANISSSKANANLAAIQKTITEMNGIHERAKATHGGIESFEKDSKQKAESMSALVKKAQEVEKKVTEYELNLSKLQEEFKAEVEKVDSLLPGAATASLASSFCAQKKRFKIPQIGWMVSFVGCIITLLVIAFVGENNLLNSLEQNWDSVLRHIVQRLPFVIPLLWLGIYSGRQYMLSLRMEEEYAFKEAISTAFEGYKREMASIPADARVTAPINALCDNVLESLSRRPGLIYEGKHQDVTPLTPIADAVEKLVSQSQKTTQVVDTTKK